MEGETEGETGREKGARQRGRERIQTVKTPREHVSSGTCHLWNRRNSRDSPCPLLTFSHLGNIPDRRGVEEIVSNKFESGPSVGAASFVVEVLHRVDQLGAVQVGGKGKLHPVRADTNQHTQLHNLSFSKTTVSMIVKCTTK